MVHPVSGQTLRVFIRRGIGYRLANPFVHLAATGILAVIAIMAEPGHEDTRPILLLPFAGLSFLFGVYHRLRGWWDLNHGVMRHSYCVGVSIFEFRWLPHFLVRNHRVARYFDPLFCALCGILLLPVSTLLGYYIVFASFCLRMNECFTYMRERNSDLDRMDSIISATIQGERVASYEPKADTRPPQPNGGIPTGLADDLKANMAGRRSRSAERK